MKSCLQSLVVCLLTAGTFLLLASPAEAQLFRRRSSSNSRSNQNYYRDGYYRGNSPRTIVPDGRLTEGQPEVPSGPIGSAIARWVDEKDLPAAEVDSVTIGANREFGSKYPYIVIDGKKLIFNQTSGHYFLYGTQKRIIFLRKPDGDYSILPDPDPNPNAPPPGLDQKPTLNYKIKPDPNAPPGAQVPVPNPYKIETATKAKAVEAPGAIAP